MSSQCSVCDLRTNKTGKHYGAITCYPCRAFFRRAQTRKRELKCKRAGNCVLNGDVKKFCPSCRYNKCISVGMKPEFVLDEDAISQRFKYSRSKNGENEDDEDNDQTVPPDVSPTSPSTSEHVSSYSPDHTPPSLIQLHSPDNPLHYQQQYHHGHHQFSNTSPGHPNQYQPPPPLLMHHPQPQDNFPTSHHQPEQEAQDLSNFVRVSVIKMNPRKASPVRHDAVDDIDMADVVDVKLEEADIMESLDVKPHIENFYDKQTSPCYSFTSQSNDDGDLAAGKRGSSCMSEPDVEEFKNINCEENMIKSYVHKKFRKHFPQFELLVDLDNFDKIVLNSEPEEERIFSTELSGKVSLYNNFLVNNTDPELDIKFEQELENLFLRSFREINLGEDVMSAYIEFCGNRHELDPKFYEGANIQFREKFLNFISKYDVIDLPFKKLYQIIKKNLPAAQSLIYVRQFNALSADDELILGCGENDYHQWENRENKNVSGVAFSQMVNYIQCEREKKLDILNNFLQLCMPIMQDLRVFIFTFLIGFLNDDSDEEIRNLRQMFISMLERYFLRNYKKFSSLNQMQNVFKILSKLPYLSELVK